jgi:hypothetical protein
LVPQSLVEEDQLRRGREETTVFDVVERQRVGREQHAEERGLRGWEEQCAGSVRERG